jgi:hypothetical protein
METMTDTRISFERLTRMSHEELEAVLKAGTAPKPQALAGYMFRGYNRPPWASLLGIRKFVKGFFEKDGKFEGYNIPPRQNAFGEPWILTPSEEQPKRFAFFVVRPVDPKSVDNLYPNATHLNYGESTRNIAIDPSRVIRDYVVQADPSNPDLFLGKAYLALPFGRVFSNYFIIERLRPTDWKP